MSIPVFSSSLTREQIAFLQAFSKSCRRSILAMVNNAQSGHPGGSLSCIDYLSLLYAFVISQTGEKVIVSNGHISPAVYAVLAEMKYIPKDEVVNSFRKIGSIYEGHVTRHVPGVWYGTGPLGVGVSAASGFAAGEWFKKSGEKVYALLGDGEAQEGQVYEMMHFASKYHQNNLIVFVDDNRVQLSGSLDDIMPLDICATFKAAKWNVITCDGHDYKDMWKALCKAQKSDKPTVIVGRTIMGKGIPLLEKDGAELKSTWHGKSPSREQSEEALKGLVLSEEEKTMIREFTKQISWKPKAPQFGKPLMKMDIDTGSPVVYGTEKPTDCRGAYGAALLDLAKRNKNILGMSADLRESVKTDGVAKEVPAQYIEVGIAEQQMVSCAGGLSLNGFIPFCSTFGAFMSSRAKDQARVNDINQANVKMVATHCGLSVGEDGPTHQAIDDMGSFTGFFNTMILEPADPNQTDRIIRYIASHYGNFYVRMGRHKIPVITKKDGSVYYDEQYEFSYGKSDLIREGTDVTVIASGSVVSEALKAVENVKDVSVELIAVSSCKKFDLAVLESIKKTKKVITVEDHNVINGLGSQLARYLEEQGVCAEKFTMLGVKEYQLSGKYEELYDAAGISSKHITDALRELSAHQ